MRCFFDARERGVDIEVRLAEARPENTYLCNETHHRALKALDGVKEVKRVVCGGCLDFKIITALDAGAFGAWEGAEFAPEKEFLEEAAKIEGITTVETQTYTFMSL